MLIVGLLAIILIFSFFSFRNNRKKQIAKLKENWGKERDGYINLDKVRRYTNLLTIPEVHELSAQTMNDIDFDKLFTFVDRTTSKIGQQYLYDRMKKPKFNKDELKEFDSQIAFFETEDNARLEVQMELLKLSSDNSYSVAALLGDNLLDPPGWFKWLIVDVAVLISSLVLGAKWPIFFIFALLVATFNVFYLNYLNKRYILQFTSSLPQLDILIKVAKNVSKLKIPFDNQCIGDSTQVFKRFQRLINLIYFGYQVKGDANIAYLPIYLFDLIKSLFLLESFTLYGLLKSIKKYQAKIDLLFRYIGVIDMAISTASMRSGEIETCTPVFTEDGKGLHIKDGIHPLIKGCVSNSIEINQRSILLTGSNMSGKSTFLRMVSINALLSQTLYTCFAKEYKAPPLRLYSSIRIDDNLFQGKSYFFQEVNVMSTLIDAVDQKGQNLYVLDEIFKGTNTIERIASAKAILSYLDQKNHIVFVSTHDIELINFLEAEYDLYHFTENVKEEELYFDHQIKTGPLKTRNAIKILKLMHFPSAIIKEANLLSDMILELSQKSDFTNRFKDQNISSEEKLL